MDVLCVGMYRACSTWQYEVACHLLERHRSAKRLGYVTGSEYAAQRGGDWSVLKSHDEDPRFVRSLAAGRALALYSYRDIRDVAFSLAHKRGTSLEGTIAQGMVHQVLANDRCWMALPASRRLVQRYEDLIADPVKGVHEMAAFLGLSLASGEAEEVAGEYSLEANRRRVDAIGRRLRDQGLNLADPKHVQRADDHTLLHWNHLREGRAGGWRDQATALQKALLGRLCADWLIARGYEPDTSWATVPIAGTHVVSHEVFLARAWLTYHLGRQARLRPGLAATFRRLTGRAPQGPATSRTIGTIRKTREHEVAH